MNKVFVEENGVYQIDCTKALWELMLYMKSIVRIR